MPATTIGEAQKVPEVESDVDGMCMDRGHFSATAAAGVGLRSTSSRRLTFPNQRTYRKTGRGEESIDAGAGLGSRESLDPGPSRCGGPRLPAVSMGSDRVAASYGFSRSFSSSRSGFGRSRATATVTLAIAAAWRTPAALRGVVPVDGNRA